MREGLTPTPTQTSPSAAENRAVQELLERLRDATLGVYEIHGELGRGGMATVFLAHEISLDRKVAIKVMSPAMVHGDGMVERFKREARTAANLSHPNIIPIYAVHEANGLLYCVIKLVEGTPLDAIMRELHQLPVPMVQGILAQVGGALGYAHRHGVIHRDIKPGNILIDDEGWAVVTDFGIAKVSASEGLTLTGMALGTPTYMSPEQATADDVSGASDQYSLGVVAYEMLTGRPPFTASSAVALMYSHNHDKPPSIRDFRPDCPQELCDAVMRMLHKDPLQRYPTMEDAVAAAGARQFSHDDPSRNQLIALAKTGLTHRIVSQARTPRSPIPRPSRSVPVKIARSPVLVGVVAVGLVIVGFLAAKMLVTPETRPADANPPAPAPVATADSVTSPLPPAAPARGIGTSSPANGGQTSAVTPPLSQRRVETPNFGRVAGSGGRVDTPQRDASPPTAVPAAESARAPLVQRAESLTQKAETTARVPVLEPPPTVTTPSPGTNVPPASSIARPTATPAEEVTAVILSYAQALAASDMAAARRIYTGMPNDQRQGLEALWRAGGAMNPSWTVSNIVINGDVATAIVRGSNAVVAGRGVTPSTVPVSLRARLERRNNEWRLVALVN
jgi:serine/threonine protein kinase